MIDIRKLPVYQHKDLIIGALTENQVIVIESPTGSGKTTQLPAILYDNGFAKEGRIGVTQPRRIAALSVSHFIARQYGGAVPGVVGYRMRFIDETVPETRIVIMTDGILLQELKFDPYLREYGVIMVDEAHERSLNIDFILGLLKNIIRERKDLKVIVSSATINARVFSEYFDECPVVSIDARMFPVRVVYDPPEVPLDSESQLSKIVDIVGKVEKEGKPGDVLIFLSGENQIKEAISALSDLNRKKTMELLPLYARLSPDEQEKVFEEYPGKRKVIAATNIAETSVTIDGVVTIIDPGYAKLNYYNPDNFTSSLVEMPVAKASCNQRKGRAGRTAPGVCYRLYTEEEFENRPLFTKEEIYRRDLSEVILRMADLGIRDFERFDFVSNPGRKSIAGAVEVLRLLDAIDERRELTAIGQLMVKFPIVPNLGRMIVASIMEYPDVLQEVLIAAAFLNDRIPFLLPHGLELEARKAHHSFRHKLGDFVSYLKIYRAYMDAPDKEAFCDRFYLDFKGMEEIRNVTRQLGEIASGIGMPLTGGGSYDNYLCAVSKGLIHYVCRREKETSYSSLTAYRIKIHPGSVMFREKPEYIVAGEIVRTSQMYARSVSPLSEEHLKRISPELYAAFVRKGKKERKKPAAARDFTRFVSIGAEKFEIELNKKKKKIVVLPLEKLIKALSETDLVDMPDFKSLRGRLVFGGYEILSDMSLGKILEAAPQIFANRQVLDKWPRGLRYDYDRDAREIVSCIPSLLHLCKKTPNAKRLGFLTLITNGEGGYWYGCYRDYTHALEESISGLEALTDEDTGALNEEQETVVSDTYRRLLEILDRR
jgi:RNA helicase HrpA